MSGGLAALGLGYLCGSVSPSWFLARTKGVDIKKSGNGNAGASNAAMVLGVRYGVLIALLDILKALLPALGAGTAWPFPPMMSAAAAGAGAVFGHVMPFWMRSRGGKGFAAYMGMVLALDWRLFLVLLAVGVVLVLVGDKIVFATATFAVGAPVGLACLQAPVYVRLLAGIASFVVLFVHAGNFRRILDGTEPSVRAVVFKRRK